MSDLQNGNFEAVFENLDFVPKENEEKKKETETEKEKGKERKRKTTKKHTKKNSKDNEKEEEEQKEEINDEIEKQHEIQLTRFEYWKIFDVYLFDYCCLFDLLLNYLFDFIYWCWFHPFNYLFILNFIVILFLIFFLFVFRNNFSMRRKMLDAVKRALPMLQSEGIDKLVKQNKHEWIKKQTWMN